jgi:transcriptional regulator with XRE-family HTH domain
MFCDKIQVPIWKRGYMDYGKRIKQFRIDRDMTQKELAEKTGLLQSQISMIENGERGLNVKTADKIVSALGVTLNDIMRE